MINVNDNVVETIREQFDFVDGLIGNIRNDYNQIIGYIACGKIDGVIYIGLTTFNKPCKTKREIDVLKALSMDRIISLVRKKDIVKFVNNKSNRIIYDVNQVKGEYIPDVRLVKNRNDIGWSCWDKIIQKSEAFVNRIRKYYIDSSYSYVILNCVEIDK